MLVCVGDAASEAGAESHAEKVPVALGAARLREPVIHERKKAREGLAVRKEVAVVANEHGNPEVVFQHRPQRDAAAKRGQVG